MLVVLQATSNGVRARRIQLRANQVAKVGRSEWADFSFSDDHAMSDVQFEVRATNDGCIVRSLSTEHPTFVNGQQIQSVTVHDGDQITAGQTKFLVHIEGERVSPTASTVMAPSPVTAVTDAPTTGTAQPVELSLVATCVYLELADDIASAATTASSADDLIDRLEQEEKFLDALRLRAHLLGKRLAVWWGCLCVRDELDEPLPRPQMSAVEAAAFWAIKPDDERRRLAEQRAAAAKYSGPGATLALSAFWSNGSIAPEGNPEVLPDDRLTSQGVAAALISAAYHGDATKATDRIHTFLERGKRIADGSEPMPEEDAAW